VSNLRARLSELTTLEAMLPDFPGHAHRVLARVQHGSEVFPIHAIELGAQDRRLPTLAFVGGVHGLERIGTQVLLSYLRTLKSALGWDEALNHLLTRMRLLFVPLLNPVGMALGLRSNGRGVDLMRNSPSNADRGSRWFELHRGQRLSPYLPWYRGQTEGEMELEAHTLCRYVEEQLFDSEFAISVDVHSGFLPGDRIWFPYARSDRPFGRTPEVLALSQLLEQTHEHHVYTIEPQCINYTTHGDLWDHVFDRHEIHGSGKVLLPLTLELSSRAWYTKNPRQLASRIGLFHPVKPHRLARAQRRHKTLFDFLMRCVLSHRRWLPTSPAHRAALLAQAEERWFTPGDP